MQALSKAEVGGNYTIQWLFGLPEVVEFLHRHHVEEGGSVQVIQKLSNGLIIGANGERFAMGNEIFFYKSVSKGVSVFYFISENCSGTPINKHSSDYFSSTA